MKHNNISRIEQEFVQYKIKVIIFNYQNDKQYNLTALAPNYERLGNPECKFSWKHNENTLLRKYIPNEASTEYTNNVANQTNKLTGKLKI